MTLKMAHDSMTYSPSSAEPLPGSPKQQQRILVCLPPGPLFSWILRGVLAQLRECDGAIRLITGRDNGTSGAILEQQQIAGVIGVWSEHGLLAKATQCGIPVVNVSDRLDHPPVCTVVCDNVAVGQLAAEHLCACGYQRLLLARKAPSIAYNRKREEGFCRIAAEHGIDVERRAFSNDVASSLTRISSGTGIFIDSDIAAFNLIENYREQGLSIPGDVGILGTDDAADICVLAQPRISSVATAGSAVGRRALQFLYESTVKGNDLPEREVLPPDGVEIRDSTDLIQVDDPVLQQTVALIRERACSTPGLSVDDIATAVHTSRRVLEQRFRRHFNGTIYNEIRRLRIHKALELLRQPDLTIQVVAQRSGFGGPDQCGQALRHVTGKGPRAWRETYARMGLI